MVSDKISDVINAHDSEFAHGLTYSGHPVACATGIATIDILKKHQLIENLNSDICDHFSQKWHALADHPIVGETRVKGMVAGMELVKDKSSRERLAVGEEGAVFCRNEAIANGVIVRAVGNALIAAPPIICNPQEIDTLIARLLIALDATAKKYGVK